MERLNNIIALDGPTGAGTSTVGQRVAEKLGWGFVSAGNVYRALTKYARSLTPVLSPEELGKELKNIEVILGNAGGFIINGMDIPIGILNTPIVNQYVSKYSPNQEVRDYVEPKIRDIALSHINGSVVEGRVMGSELFKKDALVKLYITADLEERARRRLSQFQKKDSNISLEDAIKIVNDKDEDDYRRVNSPLIRPDVVKANPYLHGYHSIIDTTEKSEIQTLKDVLFAYHCLNNQRAMLKERKNYN